MKKIIKDLPIGTKLNVKNKSYKVACHLTNVTVVIDDRKEYTMFPNDSLVIV